MSHKKKIKEFLKLLKLGAVRRWFFLPGPRSFRHYSKVFWSIIKSRRIFPQWEILEVEIQSLCDRDCVWCPRYYDRSGIRKDAMGNKVNIIMPSEKFYNIIEQAYQLGYRGKVCLHRLSEPFLDKRYVEFAKYVKEKGMKLTEFTNGDILRQDPALCLNLDGLLYSICIGLYDYANEEEKYEQMKFWLGKFKKTKVYFSLPKEHCKIRKMATPYEQADSPAHISRPCYKPYLHFLIRYDGEVSLCCEDDACNFSLGNAFKQSLKEIWWSPKHMKIARELSNRGGREKFRLCAECKADQEINLYKADDAKRQPFDAVSHVLKSKEGA